MENRRKYLRMSSGGEECTLTVDGIKLEGEIVDESISGIGITGLDLLMMPHNKPLTVEHRDGSFSGNARHVKRQEDGQFNLGVIRETELSSDEPLETAAMLINCYVKHGDALVICMPILLESDSQVLIQLWDGVQFRVPRSKLNPMSRLERFEILKDLNCLGYTAEMYGFPSASAEDARLQVFKHEFGQYEQCPVAHMEQLIASS